MSYFQKRTSKCLLIFLPRQLSNYRKSGKIFVFVPFNVKAKTMKYSHSKYKSFFSYSPDSFTSKNDNSVKPLNRGHLRVLKKLPGIERCPLLGGNFKKIVTFGTKLFVRYSWHVRFLGCPLLGNFTVLTFEE